MNQTGKPLKNKTIAFLGAGNMGEAIIQGLLVSKKVSPGQILASDLNTEKLNLLSKKFKIKIAKDNVRAAEEADIVILAVKPQQIKDLLIEIAPVINPRQVVISIAAGVRLDFLQKKLIKKIPLVRVMPNTPALIQTGAIAFALGKWAGRKEEILAREIFGVLGFVAKVEEKFLDAVTALSGSGPAYIFYLAEILTETGKKLGLSAGLSRQLTLQTIFGAAKMLVKSNEEPQLLRKKVTSPGGTTEAALKVLEEKKLSEIFHSALQAAKKRSIELGKKS
ncbi:MAG: pyrroline-5-carboxylate reductase [Elusimicrobiota bacterium]